MKFIIAFSEIEKTLREKHNLSPGIAVEIVDVPQQRTDCVVFVHVVECMPNFYSTNKLPAIKLVRTMIGGNLTQAKWIIEHWKEYSHFILAHQRFPEMRGDGVSGYFLK